MMGPGEFLLVVSFAVAMIATPGPANMLLFASGLNVGFRRTLPFLVGVSCGFQFVSIAAAAGLAGVFLAAPELSLALRVASVAYIVYLAWRIATATPRARQEASGWGFLRGLIVHPLNPKAYALAISIYATFAMTGEDYVARAVTIFLVLIVVGITFNSLWVKAGDETERSMASDDVIRWINRILAGVMVAVVAYASFAM